LTTRFNLWQGLSSDLNFMVTSILYFRIGVFIYLVAIVTVSGQDASQTPSIQQAPQPGPAQQTSEQYQATLQAFQREQLALMREKQALVKQGATDQQLTAWQQQNTARLSAQAQQAQAIAAGAVSQPVPVNAKPNIPADASPTLRDFLTTQAALANARAQIHNQSLQATPPPNVCGMSTRPSFWACKMTGQSPERSKNSGNFPPGNCHYWEISI